MTWKVLLADDSIARGWAPLSSTRPVGEILFGSMLLRERVERAFGFPVTGYLPAPGLQGFSAPDAPPIIELDGASSEQGLVILSSRYVAPLPQGTPNPLALLSPRALERPTPLYGSDGHLGWALPARASLSPETPAGGGWIDPGPPMASLETGIRLPGSLLGTPWELLERNAEQLARDLSSPNVEGYGKPRRAFRAPTGVEQIGDHPITAGEGVTVDPGAVLDSRRGPIHLAAGVQIRPFTHLMGPALVGRESTLLGGLFESFSCGPVCNLRGEVSKCVLLGYSNKAHDGYLGHSLVGQWVNLGAMTTNSDLKNNYGSIRVTSPEGEIDTGLLKLGVLLGDHVKTGIGTLLNAGTIVGVGSNLFGALPPPKFVPPFSWGSGAEFVPYQLEAFLKTADRVARRRGIEMSDEERDFLRLVWKNAHGAQPAERGP